MAQLVLVLVPWGAGGDRAAPDPPTDNRQRQVHSYG
jgi:hypothetical protein